MNSKAKPIRPSSGMHLEVDEETGDQYAAGFDVTVQAVIGRVPLGKASDQSPMEAAMAIIGRFHENIGANKGDSVYTFPGPDEGEVITVTINSSAAR